MSGLSLLATTHHTIEKLNATDSSGGFGTGHALLSIVLYVFCVAALWKVFTKANRPGWAAIIPVYNMIMILWVIKKSGWWALGLLIPFVNIIVYIIMANGLAKAFGKGIGYTLLIFFLPVVGYAMLGFGDAKYKLK